MGFFSQVIAESRRATDIAGDSDAGDSVHPIPDTMPSATSFAQHSSAQHGSAQHSSENHDTVTSNDLPTQRSVEPTAKSPLTQAPEISESQQEKHSFNADASLTKARTRSAVKQGSSRQDESIAQSSITSVDKHSRRIANSNIANSSHKPGLTDIKTPDTATPARETGHIPNGEQPAKSDEASVEFSRESRAQIQHPQYAQHSEPGTAQPRNADVHKVGESNSAINKDDTRSSASAAENATPQARWHTPAKPHETKSSPTSHVSPNEMTPRKPAQANSVHRDIQKPAPPQVRIGQVNVIVESTQPQKTLNGKKPHRYDTDSRLFLRSP